MARRPRRLTEDDQAAWGLLSRSVRPLRRSPATAPEAPAAPDAAPAAAPAPTPTPVAALAIPQRTPRPPPRAPAPLSVGDAPAGLDKASWQRLRAGRLAPERRLDLHAHTAQAAFSALDGFLRQAQADGLRCVEIITGRGRDGAGLLRREVPLWLNGPGLRPLLLAVAHPHAANDGALLLLLRRTRR